jgi:hypothetical protein
LFNANPIHSINQINMMWSLSIASSKVISRYSPRTWGEGSTMKSFEPSTLRGLLHYKCKSQHNIDLDWRYSIIVQYAKFSSSFAILLEYTNTYYKVMTSSAAKMSGEQLASSMTLIITAAAAINSGMMRHRQAAVMQRSATRSIQSGAVQKFATRPILRRKAASP